MLAIPGILLIVIFIYARPQEFSARLQMIPLLYVFFGLALFGLALDIRLKHIEIRATPILPWIVLLFGWALLTLLVHRPARPGPPIVELSICIALYLLIAHGIQTFRALHWVGGCVL